MRSSRFARMACGRAPDTLRPHRLAPSLRCEHQRLQLLQCEPSAPPRALYVTFHRFSAPFQAVRMRAPQAFVCSHGNGSLAKVITTLFLWVGFSLRSRQVLGPGQPTTPLETCTLSLPPPSRHPGLLWGKSRTWVKALGRNLSPSLAISPWALLWEGWVGLRQGLQ